MQNEPTARSPAANKPILILASGKSKNLARNKMLFVPVSPPLLDSFPIVGIGVSGTGLEAFTELLKTPSRQQKLIEKHAREDHQ